MRHGIPWWETFWKWLREQSAGHDIWDRNEEKLYALPLWLAIKQDEFWELWKEGSVVPPKR